MDDWDTVGFAAFSPDGRRVMTYSHDGTVRVWDAGTGQPVSERLTQEFNFYRRAPNCTAIDPSGRLVLTASDSRTLRVLDVETGQPLGRPLPHDAGALSSAAFSPNGRSLMSITDDKMWVASPSGSQEMYVNDTLVVRVWDSETGQLVREPLQLQGSYLSPSISSDACCALTVSYHFESTPSFEGAGVESISYDNSVIRVWEVETGQPLGKPIHLQGLGRRVLSPDGRRVLTYLDSTTKITSGPDGHREVKDSTGRRARLWDVRTGKAFAELPQRDGWIYFAAFSPDGRRVVTASTDETARVWDVEAGQPVGEPITPKDGIRSGTISPDGRKVLTTSGETAQVWDAETGQPVGEPMRHKDYVPSAAFSPDGRRVVTASWDNTAQVWDAETGHPVGEPMRHKDDINSATFSPDGARVVTASDDGTAQVWDAETGQPLGEPLRHLGEILAATFTPDGGRVLTASDDDTSAVRLWRVESGEPLGAPLRQGTILAATFTAKGPRVVTTAYDTGQVWDLETGRPVGEPLRQRGEVHSDAFSPDGRRVVIAPGGGDDSTVRIWEVLLAPTVDAGQLADLCEVVGGYRVSDLATLVPLDDQRERIDQLRQIAARVPRGEPTASFIRWFFSSPWERTISPSSKITVPDYIREVLENGSDTEKERLRIDFAGHPLLVKP